MARPKRHPFSTKSRDRRPALIRLDPVSARRQPAPSGSLRTIQEHTPPLIRRRNLSHMTLRWLYRQPLPDYEF